MRVPNHLVHTIELLHSPNTENMIITSNQAYTETKYGTILLSESFYFHQ